MTLAESLDALVIEHDRIGSPLRDHLAPGRPPVEVDAALSGLGLVPPSELTDLFAWHDIEDGPGDRSRIEWFWPAAPFRLEEAMRARPASCPSIACRQMSTRHGTRSPWERRSTLRHVPDIGQLLADRYRIIAPLGAGGMATVYRAHDERLVREVALKILLPNLAGDPVLAAGFEREARTLAAVAHPGIVSVFDVDAGDPASGHEPFFVMELCPGGSLADRLAGGERVAPDDLVAILVSVADGLAELHGRGVVHRDVKPSNILFASDRAKLADFGLARSDSASGPSDLTAPGTVAGTLAYLAPEVLAGDVAGAPADIYALGVAAFAGLTGSLPRPATSLAELVASARAPAPLVSSISPDLGPSFDEPIAAALDPDPARRPDALAFASSMTAALGRWRRAPQPTAAAAVPIAERPIDSEATTVTAVPVGISSPTARPAEPAHRSAPAWRSLAAAAVVVLSVAGLWALASNGLVAGPPAEPGVLATTVGASASTTGAPSPTARPANTLTVADRAIAALDEVDAAIEDTTGRGGLTGNERNELERLVGIVRSALGTGDLAAARSAARELAEAVDELDDELDDEPADRLANAVAALEAMLTE